MEEKRTAILRVSAPRLLAALKLPEDVELVDCRVGFSDGVVELKIEHPSLPAVSAGAVLPWVNAEFRQEDGETKFVGWRY